MTGKKLSTSSIINFLICGAGIAIFGMLVLSPNQRAISEMEAEIRQLTVYMEEQNALLPLFKALMKITHEKGLGALWMPEKTVLPRNDIGSMPDRFKEIALAGGLQIEEVTPDVNTLIDESGLLMFYLKIKGNFFNLRKFLVAIGAIPCLDHIEQIQIHTTESADRLEMILKVWLSRE